MKTAAIYILCAGAMFVTAMWPPRRHWTTWPLLVLSLGYTFLAIFL